MIKDAILIPEDRLESMKKAKLKIEKTLGVSLDFSENSVEIEGEDGLKVMQAKNVVKAIGRGFAPERAERLFKEEQMLEILDVGANDRIKSRIIGTEGKTRHEIEKSTDASVSVYGKTVSIIGTWEQVKNAKEAIEMLINGSEHKTVYRFLEKLRKEKLLL
ncbi:MAG: KH domain-containing protein [Candidatus Aenigmatarchaeota archaeon]